MYTEQELLAIKAQQRKRWMLLGIPCLVILAFIVYSVIIRVEPLTSGLTVLLLALLIFFWDLAIRPLHRYEIHLTNMLYGRKRELACTYRSTDADISLVDGVRYYAMTFLQQDEDGGEPFDRLLYWDAEKPLPALAPDQPVHITYHDRMISHLTAH